MLCSLYQLYVTFSIVDVHDIYCINVYIYRLADAKFSPEMANLAIDRQRNRILTTIATKEALKLADNGKILILFVDVLCLCAYVVCVYL
jgi:hypothetical protein